MIETLSAHLTLADENLPNLAWQSHTLNTIRSTSLSFRALLLAKSFLHNPRNIMVVCADEKSAGKWQDNLRGILGEQAVAYFPSLGISAYEDKLPFRRILEQRLEVLVHAPQRPMVVVAPLAAVMFKLASPQSFKQQGQAFAVNEVLDLDEVYQWLIQSGYEEQSMVENVGDFSLRGCILDINPFLQENPLRIELFGDEIESIRTFDLFSQRSVEELRQVKIFPMGEFTFDENGESHGVFSAKSALTRASDIFQWLPQQNIVLDEVEKIFSQVPQLNAQQQQIYADSGLDSSLEPANFWLNLEQLEAYWNNRERLGFSSVLFEENHAQQYAMDLQGRNSGNLDLVGKNIEEFHARGAQVWVVAPNQGHAQRLKQILDGLPIAGVLVGHIEEGFWCEDLGVAYLTDHQIFNRPPRRPKKVALSSSVQSAVQLDSLNVGDVVVHQDHGVGKFKGLSRIQVADAWVDCVILEYAENATLQFPVEDLYKIEALQVSEDYTPALHKLGSKRWENAKARVRKRIVKIAKELVELYARRQVIPGHAFPPDGPAQKEFEAAFEHEDTPDQSRATQEIKKDLELNRPMDRLVCGDVGFGKTEIAFRALFKVVQERKQVAFLVPTTILAAQHYESVRNRFADWPVQVELLNRYRSPKEKRAVLGKLASGEVDVVVGTHALLSATIEFHDLGLLIIDEEQRFGVKQKERLRALRENVDTLAMSATPIPRTMHLSMTGVRDISLINTPPRNRLPIDTSVVQYDEKILTQALEAEFQRGGQSFVVYDRVKDIDQVAEKVQGWMPPARVAVAHGQMHEKDLEAVMNAFVSGSVDILVATSIIENGLDVPNANTMIVLNAHNFGMSQLYQMRGRVGRSNINAFAYLVTPASGIITPVAQKRLEALEHCTDLGSGYQLAMRDLEIRGAGNLLGDEQHGFIAEVGFDTYVRMVREAVEELQGKVATPVLQPKVELGVDAYLPENWIIDGVQRVALYQRLVRIEKLAEFGELQQELRDRYGPLPQAVTNLILTTKAGFWAKIVGIQRVQVKNGLLILTFLENPVPDLQKMSAGAEKIPYPLRFLSNTPLQMVVELPPQSGEHAKTQWAELGVGVMGDLGKVFII
ncbi:MAG: transcription-repair coupling factor [Fibrobacter sp.]|nr:transcription-repair coupling factor [Fibrobacter sp.]